MTPLTLVMLLAQVPFTVKGVQGGVEVSWREVPGSDFCELRFVRQTAGDLEALCAKAFGSERGDADEPYLVSRTVVSTSADARVTWDLIAPPMVSQRDYVVRRVRSRAKGTCRVEFEAFDDPDRPSPSGVVRLKALRGSFSFEAQPNGLVRVEHRVHMDPGGWLTPLVVEGAREQMSLAWMKRLSAGP
ncbi:MAG: START domain-containing protein [Myxococcales bacterium]|nr:START domain-containing protein [Myxococcales bacterium]